MRSITDEMRQAMYDPSTDEVLVYLLVVEANDSEMFYLTSERITITSNGQEYEPCPFKIALPDDVSDRTEQAKIEFDNVDQSMINVVRSITTAINIRLSVVLASNPDVVEVGPYDLSLSEVDYDLMKIEGTLKGPNILDEGFPSESFSPASHPTLHNL